MQVSRDIYWGILKNRNAFLYKRKAARFTKDVFSMNNRHCLSDFGLIQDGNRTGVTAVGDGKLRMNMAVKGKRRTVNGAPKVDRAGKDTKSKAKRSNKSYNFSSFQVNDKNASGRVQPCCPSINKRIAKLHRANCRAARNAKADSN